MIPNKRLVRTVPLDLNPKPPIRIGSVDNCCASNSLSPGMSVTQQRLCCFPDSCVVGATICGRLGRWHGAHGFGARSVMRIADPGLSGWRSTTNRSFEILSPSFRAMYSSDPIGVPNTVIPSGSHASGPKSPTLSGTTPALFQVLVLP